jgi:hypothetical protein
VQTFLCKGKEQVCTQVCRWRTPPENIVKINTDASFKRVLHSGGWGAISHDSEPDMCFTAAGPFAYALDAFQAEAMALSKAVDIADELHLKSALVSNEYDLGLDGVLTSDIKSCLHMCFIMSYLMYGRGFVPSWLMN